MWLGRGMDLVRHAQRMRMGNERVVSRKRTWIGRKSLQKLRTRRIMTTNLQWPATGSEQTKPTVGAEAAAAAAAAAAAVVGPVAEVGVGNIRKCRQTLT